MIFNFVGRFTDFIITVKKGGISMNVTKSSSFSCKAINSEEHDIHQDSSTTRLFDLSKVCENNFCSDSFGTNASVQDTVNSNIQNCFQTSEACNEDGNSSFNEYLNKTFLRKPSKEAHRIITKSRRGCRKRKLKAISLPISTCQWIYKSRE